MDIKPINFQIQTTLFLVDDEEAILSSLYRLFRREGYNIVRFTSAKEAIQQFTNYPVDIIITDMRMPEMNGLEFLKIAKEICPEAIRVILSGYEEKEIVLGALSNNYAHKYFLKPWDDSMLKEFISKTIRFQVELRNEKLSTALFVFNHLPSSKKFQTRIMSFLNKEDSSLNDLVEEVNKNPSLTAKVLQVANSVYYGSHKNISSIRDSIIFIGTAHVHILASAVDMSQSMLTGLPIEVQKHIEIFWEQALRRASFARKIAEEWDKTIDSQIVYVASLLQDIGLLLRICNDQEKYEKLLTIQKSENQTLSYADARIFPISHEQISAEILRLWNFPDELINAVREHHSEQTQNPICKIMSVAEMLESKNFTSLQNVPDELLKIVE